MYIYAFRFSTEKLIQQIISSLITIESSNSAQLLEVNELICYP